MWFSLLKQRRLLLQLVILSFWWIFLLIAFLLPYGLISSELGTTYIGEGGIYDWVTKAYGHRWSARVSWYYWINYPLWLASLAVMTPELLTTITGIKFSTPMMIIVELILLGLWFGLVLSSQRQYLDSKWSCRNQDGFSCLNWWARIVCSLDERCCQ